MNNIRHAEYFDPINVKEEIHIVGVGAVGSHIATFLTRLGIDRLHLWDFDDVGDHNIPNQMFRNKDINKKKTTALAEQLKEINPEVNIELHEAYENQELKGFIFACVDNIEVRKELYLSNEFNQSIKAVFDTRIGLEDGQLFSADWQKQEHIDALLEASDFKHDEVKEETTACGSKLAILPTVILVSNLAIVNFINFNKEKTLKPFITFNSFNSKISR